MAQQRNTIDTPERLKALVSGVRQELMDTLEALGGEANVRDIALHLGRPMDGLYYHLRHLQKVGLIEELGGGSGARRVRIIGDRQARLQLSYAPADAQRSAALNSLVQGMLKITQSDFVAGLANPDTELAGPNRELWASRSKGWLDAQGLLEANQLLNRLTELLRHGPRGDDDKLYALTFVLAPQPVRSARR